MRNAVGLLGFIVLVAGVGLYDYRLAVVVAGGLALVAAIVGMMVNAFRTAGPRE